MKKFCFGYLLIICIVLSAPVISSAEDMVEISVEITEINNTKANELGIKWSETIGAGEVAWSASGRTPEVLPEVPSVIEVGDWARYSALTAELKILESKGAAQILSKPKILTKSGTSAKVLVGGEVPIVASGVGGGSIDWKEYGIKTEILPKVLPDKYIDLVLTTEVSRLDWTNAVAGNPGMSKREASSNIRIKNGQTIAIAGLIETKKEENREGIPILQDIPILGVLFTRKTVNEVKTNVLIFVTPKIVE
ncbi:MAG: type II and III secretion system protein [Endomicrobiales bacterium]|nr:type II and III secretion system protein [Endomicrobiales bacterium]